jgi:2,5-diamino-6-(ribosylamino)-4(3H)-pyrimidinone 5'-phosphate reductase
VDLGGALRLLAQRHQVGTVRADAGGALNGALLRAGLADQLSIVIAPYLAAAATAGPVRLVTEPGCPDAVAPELAAVERLRQGHVWLRYDVRNEPAPDLFPAPSRQRPRSRAAWPARSAFTDPG